MQLTSIILLTACLAASASGHGQNVTLREKNVPLQKIFKEINRQTGYQFFYRDDLLDKAGRVTIQVSNAPLEEVLALCFQNRGITYSILDKTIIVEARPSPSAALQPAESLPVVSQPPPIDITGRVTDEEGNPLEGATVKVKGTNINTSTNSNGEFQLTGISYNATLEISYVGYQTLTRKLSSGGGSWKPGEAVALKMDVQNMNEVVINKGYYSEKQKYSVSNARGITAKEIEKQPVNNALLALTGRVPGLQIIQPSGLPGSGVVVRIQGVNSLQNGNYPLLVVDGVPINTEIPSSGQAYGPLPNSGESYIRQSYIGKGNTLNYLNPSDIESIEILKDADATAIYGSRAANGAILITTKKGKAGKNLVSLDIQQGFGQVGNFMDLLSTKQYLEMRREALKNDGLIASSNSAASGQFSYAPDLTIWDTTRFTNWQKELIGRKANYTNVTASLSGGTAGIQYLVSTRFHRETTVFPGNYSNSNGAFYLNLNNNDVKQKFHFQFSSSYFVDDNKLPSVDLTAISLLLVPNAPALYNSDGSLNWSPDPNGNSTFINPLAKYKYQTYQIKTANLVTSGNLGYEITPGFNIGATVGFTNLVSDDYQLNYKEAKKPEDRNLPSTVRSTFFGNSKLNTWIVEPRASYQKTVNKSKFDALIGSTFQQTDKEAGYIYAEGFNNDAVMKAPSAAPIFIPDSYIKTSYKYNAVYGRFNYLFSDKYVFNLTGRRDGSSRFGANNKFQNFWSVGAGWIFGQEVFFEKYFSFISFGKFRANYGTSGSDQIGDYRYLSLYNIINPAIPYQGTSGLVPSDIPNPYLQWEETKKLSIGIDLGFLDDRINVSADYNRNRSSNQLLSYTLPRTTGRTSILTNFPSIVQNTSWEFSLHSQNIKGKDFKWNSSFNLTIPRNKLVEFPNLKNSPYSTIYIVGEPTSVTKLYKFFGVDPITGVYTFNVNGNPSTPNSLTDRIVVLSEFSKLYGGFQSIFEYKGFQMDFFFQFVKKKAISPEFGVTTIPGSFFAFNSSGNQPRSVMSRWQKPGDITNIQRFTANASGNMALAFSNARSSDVFYEDASFVKLKNVSLSWELPRTMAERIRLRNCKVYISAQNVLTFSPYKGLDPENTSFSTLPPLRTITAGLQIKF